MITDSVASSLQGEPRTTHAIDVVIAIRMPGDQAVARLKAEFAEPDFYLDEQTARDAIAARGMFDLIDTRGARRSTSGCSPTTRLHVSAPEDTILMKLRSAAMLGGSEKQFTDALRIYEVQRARLDEAYLAGWAGTLGLTEALDRLRAEADPLS
jgi:hypothetical protein